MIWLPYKMMKLKVLRTCRRGYIECSGRGLCLVIRRRIGGVIIIKIPDFEKILRLSPYVDSWLHLLQLGVHGELQRSSLC